MFAVMSRRTILAGLFPEFRDNFGVGAAQVDQKPEGYERHSSGKSYCSSVQ